MAYIFMDESGDLGLCEKGGSQYFLVTFLMIQSEKEVSIVMKNVYKWMLGKKLKRKGSFFHSNKESKQSVKRALDLTSHRNLKIFISVINKRNSQYQQYNSHILYNTMIVHLLKQCEKRGYLNFKGFLSFYRFS